MNLATVLPNRRAVAAACLFLGTQLAAALTAAAAPTPAVLHELWRAGGEDDEVLFGSVAAVKTDAQGHLLLLDSQLAEVHVYGPDGKHLATLGREGDGPGETRRPGDMALLPDGTAALVQGFPGRLVKIAPDGTPAGQVTYSPPGGPTAGQFAALIRALAAGDDLLMAGIRMTAGGSQSTQTYFLALCDANGVEQKSLLTKQNVIDYADLRLDERATDFIWARVAVGPDGKVFVAPERDAYAIEVFAPDGSELRTITRDYQAPPRTERQRETATRTLKGVGAYYPAPLKGVTIADTEPAVGGLWVTADDRLWVATGRSDRDVPAGCWTVLDVFDGNGAFLRQVALPGDHDPLQDALYVLPDGRVVVVTGALDAWLNQQATGGGDAAGTPLEVICYKMDAF